MKLSLTLVAMLCLQSSLSSAQSQAEVIDALNNLQHEMSSCIAYNTIVASCIKSTDPRTAQNYDDAAEHLLILSNKIGRTIGMTQDAMSSRMTLEWRKMDDLIKHDCVNISSLTSRHAFRCKQVTEDGDSVLHEYLNAN